MSHQPQQQSIKNDFFVEHEELGSLLVIRYSRTID